MCTLHQDPRWNALPQAWAEASARVEQGPGLDCLTADEILIYLDTRRGRGTPEEQRALWGRARGHLAECSFCAREVAALYRARRDREVRRRATAALGECISRVAACVRVAVESARGAFTAADGLLSGLGSPARLVPVLSPVRCGVARGEPARDGNTDSADEEDALHEVIVSGDALSPAELQLCREGEGGEISLTLREPLEVRLVHPDGSSQNVPLEASGGRYYAAIENLTEGEYCLALLRPEPHLSSPPGT